MKPRKAEILYLTVYNNNNNIFLMVSVENTGLYLAHNYADHPGSVLPGSGLPGSGPGSGLPGSGLPRDHLHRCTNKLNSLYVLNLPVNKRIGSK